MLLGLPCCACQPVRHAQQTVALADSLRVNEGITCDDSLALANAYTTLGHWRLIYPNAYARVCYYYGRMLRNRNDQVAAMRAFISGTHAPYVQRIVPLPWFTDYHILGRIYSNMGTMCHLADEFELSYEMYEQSAEQFHKSKDTTAYYYTLNAMALQLAEQRKHDETLSLLEKIETECTDTNVLTKTWETKTILYKNIEQYDSAIYAAKELYARGYYAATGYVTEAQSFWYLQQYDSAVYYAKVVMSHPYVSAKNKFNMLYILAYHDEQVDQDEKMKRSEERADIDKQILDPLHIQLAQAIDVLLKDRDIKPYYISIGILIIVVCILAMTSRIAVLRIKRYRKQSIETIEAKFSELQQNISEQREKLYVETERERHKQRYLQRQQETLYLERITAIEQNSKAIYNSPNWKDELHWRDYDALCETVDHYFMLLATKLKATNKLEEKEIRLCLLVLLEMDNFTIAKTINYAPNGIGKYKYRIAQKMGTTIKYLRQFLIEMAIGK